MKKTLISVAIFWLFIAGIVYIGRRSIVKTVWINEAIADQISNKTTPGPFTATKVYFHISDMNTKAVRRFEFGFRSDGVVVWREVK